MCISFLSIESQIPKVIIEFARVICHTKALLVMLRATLKSFQKVVLVLRKTGLSQLFSTKPNWLAFHSFV